MEQHPDSPPPAAQTAASDDSLTGLAPPPAAENALAPHAPPPPLRDAPELPDDVDLSDYKWIPVLRKPRKDGWTPQRQVAFIAALADSGCVEQAAQAAGMSVQSCYRLRRAPESRGFARAWDVAIAHAARRLVDIAFDRAIHGSDEPVFDKDGNRLGRRMRQNDRLLMFLLRAYMPERFRHAHRDWRSPAEPLPPAPEPLGEALERLEPAAPEAPHLLMPPDELETELAVADICDGDLPHFYRGTGDADPSTVPPGFEDEAAGDHGDDDPFLA